MKIPKHLALWSIPIGLGVASYLLEYAVGMLGGFADSLGNAGQPEALSMWINAASVCFLACLIAASVGNSRSFVAQRRWMLASPIAMLINYAYALGRAIAFGKWYGLAIMIMPILALALFSVYLCYFGHEDKSEQLEDAAVSQ